MNYNFHKAIIFLLFLSISFTVQNMQEYGFALTLILPIKTESTVRFSDVFRGLRKDALGTNGLSH